MSTKSLYINYFCAFYSVCVFAGNLPDWNSHYQLYRLYEGYADRLFLCAVCVYISFKGNCRHYHDPASTGGNGSDCDLSDLRQRHSAVHVYHLFHNESGAAQFQAAGQQCTERYLYLLCDHSGRQLSEIDTGDRIHKTV